MDPWVEAPTGKVGFGALLPWKRESEFGLNIYANKPELTKRLLDILICS